MTNSIKRAMPAALLSLGLLAAAPAARAQTNGGRIATIDMQKVSDKDYIWQQAKQALNKEKADLDKSLQEQAKVITKEQDDYKKLRSQVDDPMITAAEKADREKTAAAKLEAIQTDEASYQELRNQGAQTLDLHYQNLTDTVLQDIQRAVKAKARAAGYSLVLNVSSDALQPNSPVLYSNGENDITDVIIKELNAMTPDSATTSTNSDVKRK